MYAVISCITTETIVHLAPISARITLMVAMPGVYNKQNVKNASALADEKHIALVGSRRLAPTSSFVCETLLMIPMLLTISSLAINPASNALTAPHSPKPSGAKTGARTWAILCNILIFPLFAALSPINSKLSVKLCSSQMIIEKQNI